MKPVVKKVLIGSLAVAFAADVAFLMRVQYKDIQDLRQGAERAQQAEQWNGRSPLQCFSASGKEQTVRVHDHDDLKIGELRQRIARGTCTPYTPA